MDHYEIWFDLVDSARDLEFAESAHAYLQHLRENGWIEDWSLRRRKLGFGPPELGEFQIRIGTRDMAQLDQAFRNAARRSGDFERLHRAVYSAVREPRFALSRDFPDPDRA